MANELPPPGTFRTSTHYELVAYQALSPDERELIGELRSDPAFYGLLRPAPGSGLTAKLVGRATAELLRQLRKPGPVALGQDAGDGPDRREVVGLVLDGVLEVRDAGRFVCGADAVGSVIEPSALGANGDGPADGFLARLSMSALAHVEALETRDPRHAAAELYAYPTTEWRSLRSRFPDAGAVEGFLCRGAGDRFGHRLETAWQRRPPEIAGGWLAWRRRDQQAPRLADIGCKLYLSPATDDLPEVFQVLVDILRRHPSPYFKVGADALGVSRPDKLVVYYDSEEQLRPAAEALVERLRGVAVQGVPFTAELPGEGLLSWAFDPPRGTTRIPWRFGESWRLWVTNRLAVALMAAKGALAGTAVSPSDFALARLGVDGVDTRQWLPSDTDWAPPPAGTRGVSP